MTIRCLTGHEAVGPDLGASVPGRRADQATVQTIIFGFEEHFLVPVAALGDVMGDAWHHHACNPCHASPLARPSPAIFQRLCPGCDIW